MIWYFLQIKSIVFYNLFYNHKILYMVYHIMGNLLKCDHRRLIVLILINYILIMENYSYLDLRNNR